MIEITHISLGFLSLISGFTVLLMTKGNARHRLVGRVYAASMLGLNLTALGIYKLYGGWGFFHWMAIASLIPLVAGYLAIRFKKIEAHYFFMNWSFIGLLCATISEIFVHVPMAVELLRNVPHVDTGLMLLFIGSGFVLLPKYRHKYLADH